MKVNVTTESSVSFEGKQYATLATFLAARRVLGANRFKYKDTNKSLSQGINSAYSITGSLMDELVASALGASSVVNTAGHGVIFDNIIVNSETNTVEISENKLVSAVVSKEGLVEKISQISVAGGAGITLTSGKKSFFTADTIDVGSITTTKSTFADKADVSAAISAVEVSLTKDFLNKLVKNKDNQNALKSIIGSNKSKAAVALRKNFELKSSDIRVVLNVNGKAIIRSIGWTWDDIAKNPKAKISVIPNEDGSVSFNIYFTEALVKEALNKSETILKQQELKISKEIAESLAKQFAAFSPSVIAFLDNYSIQLSRTYDVGSLLVASGKISDTTNSKVVKTKSDKESKQSFISGVQWTVLTQKRLGETMLRLGEPEPPELKERSGRFRSSVQVFANYRTSTLQYIYNPLYSSLHKYGYRPDLQIETAIREVAQSLYAQKFNIVRGNKV